MSYWRDYKTTNLQLFLPIKPILRPDLCNFHYFFVLVIDPKVKKFLGHLYNSIE